MTQTEQFKLTRDRPGGGKPLVVRGEAYRPAPGDGTEAESPATVVICHGFKGFAHWAFFPYLAQTIAEYGMRAVTFDFSGSGVGDDRENFTALEEFTTNTFSQEQADLDEVIAESRRRGWIDREFGLFGHSRGGGAAILRASVDRDVKALVTWAAISTTSRWDEDAVRDWRARGYTDIENSRTHQTMRLGTAVLDDVESLGKTKLDLAAAARRISVPWLVVHGDADETVPVTEAEQLHELSQGFSTLWTVEGAGHAFGASHPVSHPPPLLALVTRGTVQFLSEHLTRAAV